MSLIEFLRSPGVSEFSPRQIVLLNLGPLAALLIVAFADLTPGSRAATYTAAIAVWMAIWWMSECAPLPVTALLPLILLPAVGVLSTEAVAAEYFNSTVLLFVGGFIIALAMQRWGLHRRMALGILRRTGSHPRTLLIGFMAATAFISWWVNNTATTMLMLPIALAIVLQLEQELSNAAAGFNRALILAAAYASSIGGIATPVGTPTNLILMRQYELLFPDEPQLTFARWMALFIPVSCLLLLAAWLLLERLGGRLTGSLRADLLDEELRSLGPVSFEQRTVFAIFASAALLWITRSPIEIGAITFPGWGTLFTRFGTGGDANHYVDDGTVAIALGVLLFLIPSRTPGARALMRWEDTRELPWGTVLLFGGGFALAEAFFSSGLAGWFGTQLQGLSGIHPIAAIALIYVFITVLSEFASNTASAQLVLPIVGAAAMGMGLPPLAPMLAAATGASLDFVLPAATPPNAMVISTGRVSVAQLVRTGLLMEVICAVTMTAAIWLFSQVLG